MSFEDANDMYRRAGSHALRLAIDKSEAGFSRPFDPEVRGEKQENKPKPVLLPTPWLRPDPVSLPPRPWLYGRYLMRGTLSLTVAPGGVGKSSLAIAEAIAMASNRNLLDQNIHGGPLRTWYVNCEDPNEPDNPELTRRAEGVCLHYGLSNAELDGRFFLDSAVMTPLKLAGLASKGQSFSIHEDEVERLEAEVVRNRIDVLLIDPFVSIHDLSENDNPMIDRLAKRLIRLAASARCAIGLVHHTRKSNGHQHDAESARGASSLVAAARIVRVLNPMKKEEGERAGLAEGEHRRIFRASLDKLNQAPPETDRNWYRLESVFLGNGTPPLHADQDEVGIPQRWSWPAQHLVANPDVVLKVQRAIDGRDLALNPQAKDWAGWTVAPCLDRALHPKSRGAPDGFRPVDAQIRRWIAEGFLEEIEIPNCRTGRRQKVVRVGEWADPPHPVSNSVEGCESVE